MIAGKTKSWSLRIMQRLYHARKKIITHLLTMAIILLHQEVCGIIRATKRMMMQMKMMLLVIIG